MPHLVSAPVRTDTPTAWATAAARTRSALPRTRSALRACAGFVGDAAKRSLERSSAPQLGLVAHDLHARGHPAGAHELWGDDASRGDAGCVQPTKCAIFRLSV